MLLHRYILRRLPPTLTLSIHMFTVCYKTYIKAETCIKTPVCAAHLSADNMWQQQRILKTVENKAEELSVVEGISYRSLNVINVPDAIRASDWRKQLSSSVSTLRISLPPRFFTLYLSQVHFRFISVTSTMTNAFILKVSAHPLFSVRQLHPVAPQLLQNNTEHRRPEGSWPDLPDCALWFLLKTEPLKQLTNIQFSVWESVLTWSCFRLRGDTASSQSQT